MVTSKLINVQVYNWQHIGQLNLEEVDMQLDMYVYIFL